MRTIPSVNDFSTADCPIIPCRFCLLSARSCRLFDFILFSRCKLAKRSARRWLN